MSKISRDEVERRLAFVEAALARQTPLAKLYAKDGEFRRRFGIGRRAVERYVRRVHERWEAEGRSTDRESKRRSLERAALVVYRRALRRRDFRSANAALDLIAKLHGMLVQQVDVSGSLNIRRDLSKLSDEELSALEALHRKASGS